MKKAIMFPGQGSQYKGMGKELFSKYKKETKIASDILGYDLEELCVKDPNRNLTKTQFTQPALYVVNHFRFKELSEKPDFALGHSLGEYNALLIAGVFDFETGLRIVKKRGELMANAPRGGMAAVLGLGVEELEKEMLVSEYADLDIANFNTPTQTVISGSYDSIKKIVADFTKREIKIVPLNVGSSFHSRYMDAAAREFSEFLKQFSFKEFTIPVISNVTAKPYKNHQVKELLSSQISKSVQWVDSIRYLMGQNVNNFIEEGRGVLTKMVTEIQNKCDAILEKENENIKTDKTETNQGKVIEDKLSQKLGNISFRKDYNIKYNYVAGSMYKGTASKELVIRMAKARMLSFFGTGGLSLEEISKNINEIQNELSNNEVYGVNLLHNLGNPEFEMDQVKLYLSKGIKNIEASAYMHITESLAYFHIIGLSKTQDGKIVNNHKILAKISRPEVAEAFMKPVPEKIVAELLKKRLITEEQAFLSKSVPLSYDVCVEADSGGHTDRGNATVLLPAIQRLRNDIQEAYKYSKNIRIGLAGGIGTPNAAASAFVMGADFVLTGSINQCTVEAGTSKEVKDLLQTMNVQDTGYAPSGDMFELGSKVQVLKKGILFPARASKLYTLYTQYNSLEEIPEKTKLQLEKNYFKRPIAKIWEETQNYLKLKNKEEEILKAEKRPKHKMSLIFKWYFGYSSRLSFEGDIDNKVDFQIHTGPALGAFNQWVKGTQLEDWRNRHVDEIGEKIMEETAALLKYNLERLY